MKKKMQLDKNTVERMVELIKVFFKNERNEEIGDLSARIVLEFIVNNLAPEFYNQGIRECIIAMHDKVEDLYGCEI